MAPYHSWPTKVSASGLLAATAMNYSCSLPWHNELWPRTISQSKPSFPWITSCQVFGHNSNKISMNTLTSQGPQFSHKIQSIWKAHQTAGVRVASLSSGIVGIWDRSFFVEKYFASHCRILNGISGLFIHEMPIASFYQVWELNGFSGIAHVPWTGRKVVAAGNHCLRTLVILSPLLMPWKMARSSICLEAYYQARFRCFQRTLGLESNLYSSALLVGQPEGRASCSGMISAFGCLLTHEYHV